ncbi:uncharacterized protein [Palaemon carinicauda]|uniref:uncharacterized protein n=1 Tax=Palaemon carinicauda TaxID=392227 RepID=UPI0035B6865C
MEVQGTRRRGSPKRRWLDCIKDDLRSKEKKKGISNKTQESRLRWYGHVMRRDEQYIGRRVMEMEVQGTRRRGRPKRRWVDCIKEDLRSKGKKKGISNKIQESKPRWYGHVMRRDEQYIGRRVM